MDNHEIYLNNERKQTTVIVDEMTLIKPFMMEMTRLISELSDLIAKYNTKDDEEIK